MSKEHLISLKNYIEEILSKEEVQWLGETLLNGVSDDEFEMPYTKDELIQRAMEGHKQIQSGHYHSDDEVFKILEERYELEAV